MTDLQRVLGDHPRVVAHVRQDPELCGWLSLGNEGLPEALLKFPTGWDAPRALEILGWLPAWRLLQAARLELGTSVRLMGAGWVRGRLQNLLKRIGCFEAREHGAADAVLVWGALARHWEAALRACRDRGTVVWSDAEARPFDVNLYPDVHRRGLRVIAVPLTTNPEGEDWAQALKELAFLFRGGLGSGP